MVFLPYSLASPSPLSHASACVSFILPFIQWLVSSLCAWHRSRYWDTELNKTWYFLEKGRQQPCNFRGHLLLGRREVLAERLSSLRSLGSSDLVESPLCRGPFVGHSVSSKCSPAPLSHLQRWPLRSHVRHSPLLPLRGQPHQTRLCAGLSVSVLCPLLLTSEWIFCLVSFPPFFLTLWLLLLQAWPGMSALGHLSWHMQDWASKATSPHLSDLVRTTEVLCYLHCLILVCSRHVGHI